MGLPNVGKNTIFSRLINSKVRISTYPGSTNGFRNMRWNYAHPLPYSRPVCRRSRNPQIPIWLLAQVQPAPVINCHARASLLAQMYDASNLKLMKKNDGDFSVDFPIRANFCKSGGIAGGISKHIVLEPAITRNSWLSPSPNTKPSHVDGFLFA